MLVTVIQGVSKFAIPNSERGRKAPLCELEKYLKKNRFS
jgi:hypothetical protein